MPNISHEDRLMIQVTGEAREYYNKTLLPVLEWPNHPEMPRQCWDVVTNEAFYAGCEGIGRNEENGWYLLLCDPDPGPPKDTRPWWKKITDKLLAKLDPAGHGIVVLNAGVIGGSWKKYTDANSNVYILFVERGEVRTNHRRN